MPDTQAEPVPEIQLVPGRDGREGGEPAEPRLHGRPAVGEAGHGRHQFRVADGKAYLAPVYDMGSKEIVAWDVSRHPDMAQQWRLLAMLEEKLPEDANPILHSDMGWQYRHRWWRDRLAGLNIRQSMSRKGNCIDNAATEQVFGHLKDEFYAGREFASYEQFKNELDAYIIHWNTKRRQIRLEGHTPEEFRNMSLTA